MQNKSNRYVIKFSKSGYVKYTSHLDLLRVFKRTFKKTGITLKYSQGFNPHPKMGFAQPLSLGYSSRGELIEFETVNNYKPSEILQKMKDEMPEGIELMLCEELDDNIKSLASEAISAEYKIWIPTKFDESRLQTELSKYLSKDEILTLKKQKKSKEMKPVDIKPMIKNVEIMKTGDFAFIKALLDCGSQSNCSPELLINSFCESAMIDTPRYEIEVERTKLNFSKNLQF